jgi:hypothetical protein
MTSRTDKDVYDAYMAGVRDGTGMAMSLARAMVNQTFVDLAAALHKDEKLLGNASGAGSVPAV